MCSTAQTLVLALLAGSKLAYGIPTAPAPSSSSSPEYSISQVAQTKFDNIQGLPGVGAASVGSNSIYQNLKYPGFSLVETMAPATGQLRAHIDSTAKLFQRRPNVTMAWHERSLSSCIVLRTCTVLHS